MTRHTHDVGVSRRAVLAGLGSTAGLLAASGSALGQAQSEGIVTRAAIPEAGEEYDSADLAGYFVHVDADADPVQAPVSQECGYANWSREESMAYEVLLIDRTDPDAFSTQTRVYVSDERTVPRGGLFIVNEVHPCEGSYTGVELEQIAADASVLADVETDSAAATEPAGTDPGDDATTAADGAGLGVLAALSGLAGAGALARLRDRDE